MGKNEPIAPETDSDGEDTRDATSKRNNSDSNVNDLPRVQMTVIKQFDDDMSRLGLSKELCEPAPAVPFVKKRESEAEYDQYQDQEFAHAFKRQEHNAFDDLRNENLTSQEKRMKEREEDFQKRREQKARSASKGNPGGTDTKGKPRTSGRMSSQGGGERERTRSKDGETPESADKKKGLFGFLKKDKDHQ
eukprot:CAMPEP_0184701468 /NCGR_PEP_ID=MMETSP0313-20130426/20041_1 /TAXON_ID=2792 /ORGANISM="Porphyridium aerugineum, Strain SAG 1380-2" /LENGTH=190 /DNA_ID=CAMNT_0027161543 /DNA_START=148 /DNA_END=720 /DNA_ORIENTATION=-